MSISGGFEGCYEKLVKIVGRGKNNDLVIVYKAGDSTYRLKYWDDIKEEIARDDEEELRVVLHMNYRELEIILRERQADLFGKDDNGDKTKNI